MPEEPEQEETYAAADETSGYENNGYQSRYAQEMKKIYSHPMKRISVKVNLILTQDMNMNQTA